MCGISAPNGAETHMIAKSKFPFWNPLKFHFEIPKIAFFHPLANGPPIQLTILSRNSGFAAATDNALNQQQQQDLVNFLRSL